MIIDFKAVKPFSKIARFYDELMEYVSYKTWVNYSLSFLDIFNVKKRRFLDLACGTLTPTIYLSEFCEDIVGLDRSIQMLLVGKAKIQKLKDKKIKLIVSDLRNFHFKKKFDAIFCFFDSMNYLLSKEELYNCFKCAYENLERGGAFIFDMNTIFALKEIWDKRLEVKVHKNFTSIWKNEWFEDEKISKLEIQIEWEENGLKKSVKEFHFEKGYKVEEIINILKKAGFRIANVYEHLKYSEPNSYTTRVQYVSIK